MRLFRVLKPDEIEVKVAPNGLGERNVKLVLYSTSRAVQSLLDEALGPFGWSDEYTSIDGKLVCAITMTDENGKTVTKTDVGVPSQFERTKGEFSDAFKRAGVKCGIGRELYFSPEIWVSRNDVNVMQKKDRDNNTFEYTNDRFGVEAIEYDDDQSPAAQVSYIAVRNLTLDKTIFRWGVKLAQNELVGGDGGSNDDEPVQEEFDSVELTPAPVVTAQEVDAPEPTTAEKQKDNQVPDAPAPQEVEKPKRTRKAKKKAEEPLKQPETAEEETPQEVPAAEKAAEDLATDEVPSEPDAAPESNATEEERPEEQPEDLNPTDDASESGSTGSIDDDFADLKGKAVTASDLVSRYGLSADTFDSELDDDEADVMFGNAEGVVVGGSYDPETDGKTPIFWGLYRRLRPQKTIGQLDMSNPLDQRALWELAIDCKPMGDEELGRLHEAALSYYNSLPAATRKAVYQHGDKFNAMEMAEDA